MKKIITGLVFLSQLSPINAFANSLEGKFTFDGKAPQVSLIYFEDNSSSNPQLNIDQKNKEFTKKMVVGSQKSNVVFKNSDSIEHNIYGSLKGKVLFDIGLASPGSVHNQHITWENGSVARLSCKIHPKMNAWIASVNSKYYSVVEFNNKKEKSFSILNVPDKLNKVKIWFPNLSEQDIEINTNQTKEIIIKKGNKEIGKLNLSFK